MPSENMTNRERASAWLHATWPSHQIWPSSAADSLAALLDEVDDTAYAAGIADASTAQNLVADAAPPLRPLAEDKER